MGKNRKSSSNTSNVNSVNPNITSEVQKELDQLVESENISYEITENGVIVTRDGVDYDVANEFINHKNFSINGDTPESLSKMFKYYDEYPPDLQTVKKIHLIDTLSSEKDNSDILGLYRVNSPNEIDLARSILDGNHPDGEYNSLRYVMYHESAHSLDYEKGSFVAKFGGNKGKKMVGAVTDGKTWNHHSYPSCTGYASTCIYMGGNPARENWAEAIAIEATYRSTGSCKNIPKPNGFTDNQENYSDYDEWSKDKGYWASDFYDEIAFDSKENRKYLWFTYDD